MNAGVRASIVIPTTADRGPLLPFSVGSALAQSVAEVEVLIIGDGVDDETRDQARALERADPRVRFFDHPKHPRRGEPYRHKVLMDHANGSIVAYLCDRDMMLPNHIEELERLLTQSDFAHTLRFRIREDGSFRFEHFADLRDPTVRQNANWRNIQLPLPFVGHSMSMYRKLPFGWRETPPGVWTDDYMWIQFLDHHQCRVMSSANPTVLTFKRGIHPGWPTEQRREELERWASRARTEGLDLLTRQIHDELWRTWSQLEHQRFTSISRRARRRVGSTRRFARNLLGSIRTR
jgi:glycosyltransferase involved in cell wall biosynthesis